MTSMKSKYVKCRLFLLNMGIFYFVYVTCYKLEEYCGRWHCDYEHLIKQITSLVRNQCVGCQCWLMTSFDHLTNQLIAINCG